MSYKKEGLKMEKIAQNIKNIRLINQLTQVEMSNLLGYSERQIRRFETIGTSSLAVIKRISEVFNVSIIEILS